jgi:hypothetical protein
MGDDLFFYVSRFRSRCSPRMQFEIPRISASGSGDYLDAFSGSVACRLFHPQGIVLPSITREPLQ